MKKFRVCFLLLIVLTLCLSLVACGKNDDEGNGGEDSGATYQEAQDIIRNLPSSTDKVALEENVKKAVAESITLPSATSLSGQSYSFNNKSAYEVKVTGSTTTAAEYYASIKTSLTASGWTLVEDELSAVKVSNSIAYTFGIDYENNTDKTFDIYFGVVEAADIGGGNDNTGGSGFILIEKDGKTISNNEDTDIYLLNDFALSNYKIYCSENGNTSSVVATEAMLSAEDIAKIKTAGNHTLTFNYKGYSATMLVHIKENLPMRDEALSFLKTIYSDYTNLPSGIFYQLTQKININNLDSEVNSNYYLVKDDLLDNHNGSVILLYEGINAIYLNHIGKLDITTENDFGGQMLKQSVSFEGDKYTAKLIASKEFGRRYWYEDTICYDEATKSLSAKITSGVGAENGINCIIEFNKISDTQYAMLLKSYDGDKINCIKAIFDNQKIVVSLTKHINANTDTIYKNEIVNSSYADNGDVIFKLENNSVSVTNNLVSAEKVFVDELFGKINVLYTAVDEKYQLDSEKWSQPNSDLYDIKGALEYVDFFEYLVPYLIKSDSASEDVSISFANGIYSATINGDVYTCQFDKANNRIKITFNTNERVLEIKKLGGYYFISYSVFNGSEYKTTKAVFNESVNAGKVSVEYTAAFKNVDLYNVDFTYQSYVTALQSPTEYDYAYSFGENNVTKM